MANDVVVTDLKTDIMKMESQFAMALPPHIKPERFVRVVMTAVSMNPDLMTADRRSLLASCTKAAQDGLMLDGREAALVTFNTKTKDGNWVKQVQYMPMVTGLLKKARNSGDISTISAHVAYENDTFEYVLGDQETITHKPYMGANRGKPVAVYAIAHLKDGGIMREIMTVGEVEKVRAASRSKDRGPWVDWWDEMAKKTAIRRLSKYLPSSTDREGDFGNVVERDDDLYEFESPQEPDSLPIVKAADAVNKLVATATKNKASAPQKAAVAPKPQPPAAESSPVIDAEVVEDAEASQVDADAIF